MRRFFATAALSLALALPLVAADAAPAGKKQSSRAAAIDPALAAAAADSRRNEDRARDQYRRPAETLTFFKVTPEMKVGEYAPGGGWYSRLLGLYLGPRGKLVGLYLDPTSGAFNEATQKGIRDGAAKYAADVAGWSGQPAARFAAYPLDAVPTGEKGSFDRILVMRMVHNLLRWNTADREIRALRDLLKPDGMVGIEQHRAKAGAPFSYSDGSKGYLREADVIRLMELNGFTFVGRSELNANPRDSADHADGVWHLPPVLRDVTDEAEKVKLKAIGESDRMTLLFRKRP